MPTKARTRQPATETRRATRRTAPRTAKVDLPFVKAEFRVPEFHMPELHMPELHLPEINRENVTAAARSMVPSPREAAYYGGLVLLAAFEVVEWPVAAVIGVGAAVLRRGHNHEEHEARRARVPTPRQ